MEVSPGRLAFLIKKYRRKTGKIVSIGTIESATGGRIAGHITDIPGSSLYFRGSIVAYDNAIKEALVEVNTETLNLHGSVSAEAAREMAQFGRNVLKVDVCISDTGIAGPSGSTPEKPVGLFYFCLAGNNYLKEETYIFTGTREQNRCNAVAIAIKMLENYLLTIMPT